MWENLKTYFKDKGIDLLPTRLGTQLFVDELLNNPNDIEVPADRG